MSGTSEHNIWLRMKGRCADPGNKDYVRYGGRGIRVCSRWLNNFDAFFEDMGPHPAGTSIDRIDNNGNYGPANCRWSTQKQQCRNKANNHVLTYNGTSLCMTEWAERLGVDPRVIQARIVRYKWSVERTLTTPVK